MAQKTFDGIEFGFKWVGDWYEYDSNAEKVALKARNDMAKELAAQGHKVSKFSLGTQLRTMGGIGSGKPQIEILTKCYGLNY